MFGKKKPTAQIDKDQLELIDNARRRIKQKKRLYVHFVVFLISSVFIILFNLALGFGKDFRPLDTDWFVFAILIWLFFFLYHTFNVFVTHKFMGKAWEQNQLDKLVARQQQRIDKLKKKFIKEETLIAQSEAYSEAKATPNTRSELTIIAAAGENDTIGKDNQLIWHLADDLSRFKKLTNGHHIIMGRKTFESFPKPLPNRTHVVITRKEDYAAPEGVIVVQSLSEAIKIAHNDPQPFIIGGGEIYNEAMAVADKIELTRIHEYFEGDTFFPKIDPAVWKEINNTFHKTDENHEHEFSFITYIRA
jgi:dihydrofolate reductase